MSNITKLNGYDIKDSVARNEIALEIARSTGKDNELSDLISTETSNRNNAINDEKNLRLTGDNNLQSQINSLASGSPLVASSTSEMTDTTKVYVNTTDGKWYYYDGDSWEIGGTYQASELGSNEVSYNNLSDILKIDNLKKLTPTDLNWVNGYNRYNGKLTLDNTITTSQCFKVSKGTTITCNSNSIKVRYTLYNLDGSYISNTGTYRVISTYSITQDCYLSISYEGGLSDLTGLFTFEGLTENKLNLTLNYLNTQTTARLESNAIFLPKGTKIRLTDYHKQDSSSAYSDSIAYFGYNKYGIDKLSHNYVNYAQDVNYSNQEVTLDEDTYIRLYFKFKGTRSIDQSEFPNIINFFEIEIPNNLQNNYIDSNLYRVYIGDNGDSEIIENGGDVLYRLINPSNTIIIKKNKATLVEISFTSLLSLFPNNVYEYNGINYLKIPNYHSLYYSFFDSSFKISNLNTTDIGQPNIFLLVNGYGNIMKCELLDLYLKKLTSAKNIFNSGNYLTKLDWKNKVKDFTSLLLESSKNIETFTFFTDPHLMGFGTIDFSANLENYIGTLQKVYNSSPMNFIVGGGDWLNNSDTPELASLKMGYIDGFMNSMFKNYYGLVGNHDTNYQGTESISQDAINNLWYRKYGKSYYSFDGLHTKCYCLDSGKDGGYNAMNSYRWEQIDWLANSLITDDPEHAIVFSHIVWNNENVEPFADNFTKLIYAFNQHTTITLNSITYDFTNNTGRVIYVLSGHTHEDTYNSVNNILCISTTTFAYQQNKPTFDMIVNDYDNHRAYFVRYGNGDDREFTI